ncbi:hypothetical protein HPB51_015274 [Rhipicephalus microplus]|uniref:Uncharacterized protein n=1 Tax=Rhipicephalus microplus TaxID=6941 RepID=A0A9J6F4H8_RHIMP|nr:hypothetical protein HPB51_015274 [Rhipicephalus microplus]
MFPALPSPPFLQYPGVPLIPFKTWRCVVQVYVDAVAPDATPDTKKKALAVLDAHFAPPEDAFCVRTRFRRKGPYADLSQKPDEAPVQFILALQRLANNCNFGTAAEKVAQDQILHGLRDPDLLRSFVQMGDTFTIQAALEHAREEEHGAAAGCSAG